MNKRMRMERDCTQAVDADRVVERKGWRSNPRLTVFDISRVTESGASASAQEDGTVTS